MPIVGRRREIAEIGERLRASSVVTIAGAGGIGKTRLAVEVAGSPVDDTPDGVWFVDLEPIADPELIPATVAAAIGLELAPEQDSAEALIASLKGQRLLVVFDNCEHIVSHVARLASDIAAACPHVRVLATSREPLGIEPESVFRLDTLDEASSLTLFLAHAQHADPRFELTPQNEPIVRDVCRRLDGIALAIALAAVCLRVMPLGQLRARLDGRFRLLVGESRSALPRHKTMLTLIDWSYDLLADRERSAFRRLGVFSGGFTLETAGSVAAPPGGGPVEFARDFEALADKSMIVTATDDARRYRMLESIRQYALQKLQEAGEEEAARRDHATFFAARSAEAAASFGSGSEDAWLAAYAPDLDNFRAALDWARNHDVELAARIAANLAEYWEYCNLSSEGLRRSEAILAALERPNDPSALPLLIAIAGVALGTHYYRRSLEMGDRARAAAERAGDLEAMAEARRIAGRSRYLLNIDPDRSVGELGEALAFYREHGKPLQTARSLRDFASALAQRDPDEGRRLLLEALALAKSLDWPRLTVHIEINVAEREFRSGHVPNAAERARHVIQLLRGRRSSLQLGHALTNLASYLAIGGDLDDAAAAAREAVLIGRGHDTPNYVAISLQSLAVVLAERGDAPTAARLLGYVTAFYTRYSMTPEPTEAIVQKRLTELLHDRLDDEALHEGIVAGAALSEDDACALALEQTGEPAKL